MPRYLGIDLGGTRVRTVVAEIGDGIVAVARDDRATPQEPVGAVIGAIIESASAVVSQASQSGNPPVAGACAAPLPVNPHTGWIDRAANIKSLGEINLAEPLSDALRMPILVDHDTTIAAIGERLGGSARDIDDFVYVTVSTGIGGAIVANGRMTRGRDFAAGEIGHWQLRTVGARCGCGAIGCIETLAGGRWLAEKWGGSTESLFAAWATGNPRAAELVNEAQEALKVLAVGLVNTLNPSRIVVGGGLATGQPEHVLGSMRVGIEERAFSPRARRVDVVPAMLGDDVGTFGAALAASAVHEGRASWFL